MFDINQTGEFRKWMKQLRDRAAKARILTRIKRAETGNFGDSKSLGHGLLEMRIDVGPGYRLYFGQEGNVTYLLLCGGDKSSQQTDIAHAKALWAKIKKERP